MTGYSIVALQTFLPFLFAVSSKVSYSLFTQTEEDEKKWDASHNSSLRKIQQELFTKIVDRLQFVQGSALAAIILNQTRSSKDALVELDWKQF